MNLLNSTFDRVNSLIRRESGVPSPNSTPPSPSPRLSPRRERPSAEPSAPRAPSSDKTFFYVLYRCVGGKLDVVYTDCTPELEKQLRVREFVAQKLETAQMHAGGSVGLLPALVTATRVASTPSCYYALVGAERVLCLVGTVENLSLFLVDLQHFRERVEAALSTEADVAPLLAQWYSQAITYFARVISTLTAEHLAVLLHAAIVGRPVHRESAEGTDGHVLELLDDIERFIDAVRLRPAEEPDKTEALAEDALLVAMRESALAVSPTESNAYCSAWALELKGRAHEDAFTLKHAVDERKMRVMNDMNVVNKLVNQAKADHYALYACYRVLKASGNIDVLLLQLLKDADASADEATLEVLQVIFEYYKEHEAASA